MAKKKQQEENDMLPANGHPSKFFKMEVDDQGKAFINSEQTKFVQLHYVNYTDPPEDMVAIIKQLFEQACELEGMQKQEKAML